MIDVYDIYYKFFISDHAEEESRNAGSSVSRLWHKNTRLNDLLLCVQVVSLQTRNLAIPKHVLQKISDLRLLVPTQPSSSMTRRRTKLL